MIYLVVKTINRSSLTAIVHFIRYLYVCSSCMTQRLMGLEVKELIEEMGSVNCEIKSKEGDDV